MPEPTPVPGIRGPLLFDAVLRPHRSLSRTGFVVLMATISVISFAAGLVFLLLGAWPVFGFLGLDVLLIYVAFKASYRSGRLVETVQLDGRELRVRRVQPSGRVASWTFEPGWLRVTMDNPPEHHSQLVLASHGLRVAIGSFLTPGERLEVAVALRAALAKWRETPEPSHA